VGLGPIELSALYCPIEKLAQRRSPARDEPISHERRLLGI
jgi:hypothetical protein